VVVGQNRFTSSEEEPIEIMRIEPRGEGEQRARLAEVRAGRDHPVVTRCLDRLEEEARGKGNLLPPLKEALAAYATIGECCDRLRRVFGEHHPQNEV